MTAELGDIRYFVEYLDYAKGVAIMRKEGGDPDNDTLWDYCDQSEIGVRREFPSKWRAVAWAKRHKTLDVFHMPRIAEETYCYRPGDDLHDPSRPFWDETGYWEMDGTTEIEDRSHDRD